MTNLMLSCNFCKYRSSFWVDRVDEGNSKMVSLKTFSSNFVKGYPSPKRQAGPGTSIFLVKKFTKQNEVAYILWSLFCTSVLIERLVNVLTIYNASDSGFPNLQNFMIEEETCSEPLLKTRLEMDTVGPCWESSRIVLSFDLCINYWCMSRTNIFKHSKPIRNLEEISDSLYFVDYS